METQYEVCVGRPRWQCRWWLRSKPAPILPGDDGLFHGAEMYVPWWAWPLDLAHRLIFGSTKLEQLEETDQ